ncbi:MAG: AmmeMemoRadiSam system radical SAM enzyme [Calditrichaeota bacterium]|nr:AmmeMemoRadiSam system radical SAM enzyme [Calditrichota bacterium]
MNQQDKYRIDLPPGKAPHTMGRRSFLKIASSTCLLIGTPVLNWSNRSALFAMSPDDKRFVREARFYEKLQHSQVRCKLCPRKCVIDDHERGYCGVRENQDGTYYTLVYSRPCTFHVDPIEKKPLFHFLPGTTAFSIATAGCNLNCKFCQNWQISQVTPEQVDSYYLPPKKTATMAKDYNSKSIAYTYSEPTIFFEYMYDTAVEGKKQGVNSVVITAGFMEKDPVKDLCKVVDAIKVDLKAFTEDYYQKVVRGNLKPVLETMETIRNQGTWLEIVYLVVPTLNDGEKEIRELARWTMANLGPDVPIHFTRFYPQYLLKNLPPTPVSTLEKCKAIADAEGLRYVYIGNVPGHPAENTYCPKCGKILVERTGFLIKRMEITDGRCPYCKTAIPGVWRI